MVMALRAPLFALAIAYCVTSLAAASHVALKQKSVEALLLPFCFLVLHVSYGVGTLMAMIRNAHPPAPQTATQTPET